MEKTICNKYKIAGEHLQCVNNYYAKFEYKRMKSVGVTGYTDTLYVFHMEKMSKFNTPQKKENIHEICTK